MAALITIGGLDVRLAIDGGIESKVENFRDRDRNIVGGLLITTGGIGNDRENFSCRTVPYTAAERDALLTILRAGTTMSVTGEAFTGTRTYAAEVTSVTPITLLDGRYFIISFELIQD